VAALKQALAAAQASPAVQGTAGEGAPAGDSSNEVNLLQFENELLRGDVDRMQKELTALQQRQQQSPAKLSGSLQQLQPVLLQLSSVWRSSSLRAGCSNGSKAVGA